MSDRPADTEFRVLGPLEVWHQGRLLGLGKRRNRLILGVLLLDAHRLVQLDRLIELVWYGQDPARTARNSIQVAVSQLRTTLAGVAQIVTSGDGYRIEADPDAIDLHRFRHLIERARRLEGDAKVQALVAAEQLWRGPLLAGTLGHEVRQDLHSGLDEQRMVAVEERIAAELDLGRHHELISELTDLVMAHPDREGLAGKLMLALFRAGRQTTALEVFRTTRGRLVDELGVEPGLPLQQLHQRILRGDEDLTADPRPVFRYLPRDIPDFTGREAELRWMDSATNGRSPIAIISALVGFGGLGKTALAVHWAQRAIDLFPDGQIYLNLRGYSSSSPMAPAEALSQLLRMIGVASAAIPTPIDEAAALFRSQVAEKRMLILLDNAHSVEQVRPLLPGGTGTTVIVTSRDRLAGLTVRDGARRLDLDMLSQDEALRLLAQLIGEHRVAAEPVAAKQLVRTCGRLPLALRIAAANLADDPRRSIQSFTDTLAGDNRIRALEVDGDPETAVRAVFDLSLAKLTPEAAVLFRRLGLLPVSDAGSWTATILIGRDEARAKALLNELAEASLLTMHSDGSRFALHDLVQLYARGQSNQDDLPALRRLYETLLVSTASADRQLASLHYPTPAISGLTHTDIAAHAFTDAAAWLTAEQAMLTQAAQDAAGRGWHDIAWQQVANMTNFGGNMNYVNEWIQAAEEVLKSAPDGTGKSALLLGLAGFHRARGVQAPAVPMLRQARRGFIHSGDMLQAATAASQLSMAYRASGNLRAARAAIDWAIALLSNGPAVPQLGWAYVARGNLLRLTHADADVVHATYEQATAILRQTGDRAGEANALAGLGSSLHDQKRYEEAIRTYESARAILIEIKDVMAECQVDCHLGRILMDHGDIDAAWSCATRTLATARESGHPRGLIMALALAGEVAMRSGDFPVARHRLTEAVAASRVLQSPVGLAPILLELAKVHAALGDTAAALAAGEESLALFTKLGRDEKDVVADWLATIRRGCGSF